MNSDLRNIFLIAALALEAGASCSLYDNTCPLERIEVLTEPLSEDSTSAQAVVTGEFGGLRGHYSEPTFMSLREALTGTANPSGAGWCMFLVLQEGKTCAQDGSIREAWECLNVCLQLDADVQAGMTLPVVKKETITWTAPQDAHGPEKKDIAWITLATGTGSNFHSVDLDNSKLSTVFIETVSPLKVKLDVAFLKEGVPDAIQTRVSFRYSRTTVPNCS